MTFAVFFRLGDGFAIDGPILHQLGAFLEQVAAPIGGGRGRVQRRAGVIGLFGAPVAKGGAEPVGRNGVLALAVQNRQ